MFEDLIREMERLNGQSVSIPIDCDENGYLDKQCPSEDCEFLFKVHEEDWENIVEDEAAWCPLCRHEAEADQWFTLEQVEHAKAEAFAIVQGKIDSALRTSAQKFNRNQSKNGFISMTMKVEGLASRTYTIPAKAAEAMRLEIQCEECQTRFAVIGSAFFCPACGHNSVTRTYSDSLRKIKAKKDGLPIVRQALSESVGKDDAELTCRSLLETCISDGVVAFQKYCEGLYSPFGTPPFNAFQRLEQGSQLWETAIHKSFDHWLTDTDFEKLKVLYQKRHLLAHNEGIVDQQYIKKSGDFSYKQGQRIVVSERDIDDLIRCLEKLGKGLEAACESAKLNAPIELPI